MRMILLLGQGALAAPHTPSNETDQSTDNNHRIIRPLVPRIVGSYPIGTTSSVLCTGKLGLKSPPAVIGLNPFTWFGVSWIILGGVLVFIVEPFAQYVPSVDELNPFGLGLMAIPIGVSFVLLGQFIEHRRRQKIRSAGSYGLVTSDFLVDRTTAAVTKLV